MPQYRLTPRNASRYFNGIGFRAFVLSIGLLLLTGFQPAASQTAFLVLAPDRGFLGNEEMRDVFAAFQAEVPASVLAFATSEQTGENLRQALAALEKRAPGGSELIVLPLFLSEHHALYQKAYAALRAAGPPDIRFARPLGESYLAEEILFDRVAALSSDVPGHDSTGHGGHGAYRRAELVVVASGASSAEDEAAIKTDLKPLVQQAVEQFGLHGGELVMRYAWSTSQADRQAALDRSVAVIKAAAEHGRVLVVPFNFGPRLTTMMSDWNWLRLSLMDIANAVYDGQGIIPHPNVLRWLVRTANGYRPLAKEDVGVIFIPHGNDYNWNEAMRDALAPLRDEYVTEDAFSMVDPVVVERAVRRLEDKGMKAAVLVRIFSLKSSFRDQAEYLLGLQREPAGHGDHGGGRISSHLRFATVGGLEAHPLLAQGMLDRAQEISTEPEDETIILIAHGTDDDEANAHWMNNLAQLAAYIREHADKPFRDVLYFTWREDWTEKRKIAVREIRAAVEKAARDGGTALVVPVRTMGQGSAERYLEGLEYRLGTGFAPHPAFVRWMEAMIEEGIASLRNPDPERVLTE